MFAELLQTSFIMWPLLLSSVVAAAIIVERFWALRQNALLPTKLIQRLADWVQSHKNYATPLPYHKVNSSLARVLHALEYYPAKNLNDLKAHAKECCRDEVLKWERYLNTLGSIALITPLLGLLGTVIGMIKVFSVLMQGGIGQPELLAGGISEALVTTALGLSIAIPSMLCHRHFQRRIEEMEIALAKHVSHIVARLIPRQHHVASEHDRSVSMKTHTLAA